MPTDHATSQPTPQPTSQPTWTTERLDLLKSGFEAGLSCRQIAVQIGVSRNAVIGKLSRLKLPRDTGGFARPAKQESTQRRRPRGRQKLRQIMLKALSGELQPRTIEEPIHNGHTCSLMELSNATCRWPISTPGLADFCFCGNPPIEGLPYCAGHSRMAYRSTS
jgi:GcrA cell cycle regulator